MRIASCLLSILLAFGMAVAAAEPVRATAGTISRVSGPAGRIEGVAMRLYEPQTGRWSIHYASAANGELTTPLYGKFERGVGRFEGPDTLGDRPILVRFEIREAKPGTWRFEQSFSADGGRTWELNWVAEDRRVR